MRNSLVILVLCLCSLTNAVPLGLKKNMAIVQEQEDPMLVMAEDEETRPEMMISRLNLPSNATSIRADITDGFSCDNKTYGYYADVENECQIFHVCLPVTYADGKENTFRWSFICPEETVFSQEYFTCMRSEDMSIDCEESFKYYELNRNFGMIEPQEVPADEAEEEMTMEDMSRQPPSQGEEEINKQSIEDVPVKKQTVKVQNSNRRKTQANRVAIEAQRKKVQPLRRLSKPAVVATTAKAIVEEAPVIEQEVERTTLKYQRITKRPIAVIPEQPRPEEPKPEKEVVRSDLFTQKRKRPQIFFPTRFDAGGQTDSETKPLPYLKTDILLQNQAEPVLQNQPEAQAQASEITEVSIKPQVELKSTKTEKIETLPVQEKEPVFVSVSIPVKEESQPIIGLKSEIASLPENIPSRVEIVEIPIQKVDEPLMAEGSAILAPIPEVSAPEEPKPVAVEPIKDEEEEIPSEDIYLKKIIAQTEKIIESEKPVEGEKIFSDTVQVPELVSLNEPEQSLQTLKSAELPKPTDPVETVEADFESKVPEPANLSDDIPLDKAEEILVDAKPEIVLKVEAPAAEHKPEELLRDSKPEDLLKSETAEKPQVAQMSLKINVAAPEMSEPEAQKYLLDNAKSQVTEEQPEKPLKVDSESNAKDFLEIPKPEVVESKVSGADPDKPLNVEAPAPEFNKKDFAENPKLAVAESEVLGGKPDKPLNVEAPIPESIQKDLSDNPKPQVAVTEVLEAQPDKPVNVEEPALEPQILLKSEISEVKPVEPLAVDIPVSEMLLKDEVPAPEVSKLLEAPIPELNTQFDLETSALESLEKQEKLAEAEIHSSNAEISKIVETIPDAKVELPIETISKPSESSIEPIKEASPELMISSEIQAEKSNEVPAQEKVPEAQLNGENDIVQSATDNEEAQSLILDFISSLVNSENSNFEDQNAIVNDMSSDNLNEASIAEPVVAEPVVAEPVVAEPVIAEPIVPEPVVAEPVVPEPIVAEPFVAEPVVAEPVVAEPVVAEPVVAEPVIVKATPAKIQSQDDQINPLYFPMTPSNEQMYQIPVQVIESPEPAQEPAVQVPVAGEPKLPLSIDDVVELVKESLDIPVEKENLVQEPSNDDPNSQPDSEEVKPIYHRYIELGSNLLKSEALTASDDEPVVIPSENEESIAEASDKEEAAEELPKASEKLAEPEQLAMKPDAQSEDQAIKTEELAIEEKPDSQPLIDSLKEGRSLNRFKMDPRKRRFLFRSDAS